MAFTESLTFARNQGDGPTGIIFEHSESDIVGYSSSPPSYFGKVWTAFEVKREGGWRTKALPGFSGTDAQFFGGDEVIYTIRGFIISVKSTLTIRFGDLQSLRDEILKMSGSLRTYDVTNGPFNKSVTDGGAFIIRNMNFELLDGPRQPFSFEAVLLKGER